MIHWTSPNVDKTYTLHAFNYLYGKGQCSTEHPLVDTCALKYHAFDHCDINTLHFTITSFTIIYISLPVIVIVININVSYHIQTHY